MESKIVVAWIIIILLVLGLLLWAYGYLWNEEYLTWGGNMMFVGIISTAVYVKFFTQ